jgi:hypothetical protein
VSPSPDGGQLLRITKRAVQHSHRALPAASTRHRRSPGEHGERLQLGPLGNPGHVEGTLSRQLRKMQVAESGCQNECVIRGLGQKFGRGLPHAAVAGSHVNLQLDQRSVDTLTRGPVASGIAQIRR